MTVHGLRRTFNNLSRQVAGAIVTRAITGHVTEEMTEHYSHVEPAPPSCRSALGHESFTTTERHYAKPEAVAAAQQEGALRERERNLRPFPRAA